MAKTAQHNHIWVKFITFIAFCTNSHDDYIFLGKNRVSFQNILKFELLSCFKLSVLLFWDNSLLKCTKIVENILITFNSTPKNVSSINKFSRFSEFLINNKQTEKQKLYYAMNYAIKIFAVILLHTKGETFINCCHFTEICSILTHRVHPGGLFLMGQRVSTILTFPKSWTLRKWRYRDFGLSAFSPFQQHPGCPHY